MVNMKKPDYVPEAGHLKISCPVQEHPDECHQIHPQHHHKSGCQLLEHQAVDQACFRRISEIAGSELQFSGYSQRNKGLASRRRQLHEVLLARDRGHLTI